MHGLHQRYGLLQQMGAAFGQRQLQRAAVLRVGGAHGQRLGFQAVEQAGDLGARGVQR
ncbi:hypothetical protein D3C72_2374230 [compost metagenome]